MPVVVYHCISCGNTYNVLHRTWKEAEKIAGRIAIIDHGKIIAINTAQGLKKQTNTNSLEEAYLKLTGSAIREEEATGVDHLRSMRRMRRGR